MRERFRRFRSRPMAARPGERRRIDLSPRGRLLAGWVAALLLIGVVALAVRLLGGNADGSAVVPTPSASASGPEPIVFGTDLGTEGAVREGSRTDRFVREDLFAYSLPEAVPVPSPAVVYVEVTRIDGGLAETVQGVADGQQPVPEGRSVIGFSVPAANLLDAFGAGRFRMRIHAAIDGAVLGEGTFELVDPPGLSPGSS